MDYLMNEIQNVIDVDGSSFHVSRSYRICKRIIDILFSLIGMIVISPILILIAILIKIDTPGPVFFLQERCGLRGKTFKMIKFRSMVKDAEEMKKALENRNEIEGPMFKIRDDPRITRVGKFIRKTSIDELPQLLNVLAGDMSLVGPRPPILSELYQYQPWHYLRLSVKPGITGLWQISGRNNVGFEEMVRLDLKYIRERTLLSDCKIILKTIPLILGDPEAY